MARQTVMTAELAPGRVFLGRIGLAADLLGSLEEVFARLQIQAALFSATGMALKATFGVYDATQQVYAVRVETGPLEMVCCTGSVLPGEERPALFAHILLGRGRTRLFGGRLFSETLVEDAEFEVRELVGSPPIRTYDALTGRMHLHLP